MKILLTHGYFINEDEAEKKIMMPYPPLGILYISAYLEEKGVNHNIYDSTFSKKKALIDEIILGNYECIGIYVNFLTRKNVLELIDYIRQKLHTNKPKIILGGPDVRFYAEKYLLEGADYVVVGEGEETFYKLIKAIEKNNDINSVDGLVYLNSESKTISTIERNLIKDLDLLPFPNRKKIDIRKYIDTWKNNHQYSSLTINTQRGCPYSCKWCSHAVFGDTYRRRSPRSVVDELASLISNYGPDSFWFVDDVFTMSKSWMHGFKKELSAQSLKISYECITRADKLDEEILNILKDTGCNMLWIGAESGSQKVIDMMDRKVNIHHVREMIRLSKNKGIKTGTFIMLGYPGETEEDIFETINHLKECDPDIFTINTAYPIKGTKLYNEVSHMISPKYNWNSMSDREADFERTYKRSYYDFAIRKVYNEVNYYKSRMGGKNLLSLKLKLKSFAASVGMVLTK